MFLLFLEKVFAYGCAGLLIEVFFTGIHSLWTRNWRATSQTYLWMLPLYGFGGVLFEAVYASHWPRLLLALLYTVMIYTLEFFSGWALKKLLGRCPWDYGAGKYTPMGLVHLGYAPLWFALAYFFTPVSHVLSKLLQVIATGAF